MSLRGGGNTIWNYPDERRETRAEGRGPVLLQSWRTVACKGDILCSSLAHVRKAAVRGEKCLQGLEVEPGVGQSQCEVEG